MLRVRSYFEERKIVLYVVAMVLQSADHKPADTALKSNYVITKITYIFNKLYIIKAICNI